MPSQNMAHKNYDRELQEVTRNVSDASCNPRRGDDNRSDLGVQYSGERFSDEGDEKQCREKQCHYRRIIIVTLGMFSGYASTVTMQHELQNQIGITDDPDDKLKQLFTIAVSCQYIGNLIFRLGHNMFFCLGPHRRVLLAQVSMLLSMSFILSIFICGLQGREGVTIIIIAFLLSGLGIGTFESNLLASISPLGPKTKLWAVIGLPLGFNIISVGGFLALKAGFQRIHIYIYVFIINIIGGIIYNLLIPYNETRTTPSGTPRTSSMNRTSSTNAERTNMGSSTSQEENYSSESTLSNVWMATKTILLHSFALLVAMFCVSSCTGITLNIFSGDPHATHQVVPLLWDDGHSYLIDIKVYFMIQNSCIFLGDTLSRKLAYNLPGWLFAIEVEEELAYGLRDSSSSFFLENGTSILDNNRSMDHEDPDRQEYSSPTSLGGAVQTVYLPATGSNHSDTSRDQRDANGGVSLNYSVRNPSTANPLTGSLNYSSNISVISRTVSATSIPFRHPHFRQFLILCMWMGCSFIGITLISTKWGIGGIIGSCLVFFGNGTIYATTTRWIDLRISSKFKHIQLVALSVWLFVGDVGSVTGSNLTDVMHKLWCPEGVKYYNVCRVGKRRPKPEPHDAAHHDDLLLSSKPNNDTLMKLHHRHDGVKSRVNYSRTAASKETGPLTFTDFATSIETSVDTDINTSTATDYPSLTENF